jgi:hypothetical protein
MYSTDEEVWACMCGEFEAAIAPMYTIDDLSEEQNQ